MTAYLLRWFAAWLALLPWDIIYTFTVLNPTLYGKIRAQLMAFAVISIIKEVIANLLLFAAFLFVNRVYEDKTEKMKGKEAILLLSSYLPIMIGYWFSAYVSNIYMQDTNADIWDKHRFYNIFLGMFQVISYLVILTVIFSYQKIRKAEKEATLNAVAVSQIDELKRHLSSVEKLYDDMRSIRHDMSGHLMVLEGLYKKGEVQSADNYLINCQNELSKVTKWERTGNPVTDTLLTEKRNEAERKGIHFESDLEFSDKWGIEVFDI
ncbi:MAG: hypothetical protein K6A69_10045, partial [Lachnospiraceae bacterium]|nr:hypothetical protein [Lachnospiraceae bacterium]